MVSDSSNHQRMARALQAIETLESKLAAVEQARTEPIAIVGAGCRLPGGVETPEAFWQLLHQGVDAITMVPADRWDAEAYYDPNPEAVGKIVTRHGGFVEHLQEFDAAFFGISPREAMSLDPQQRLLLEVSWEAMEHAGMVPGQWAGRPVGVFVGVSSNDYSQYLLSRPVTSIDAYLATGNSHSVAAGRLSYNLGFTGPSLAVDTACSSSLVAVHLACQSLRNGESEVALCGGVNCIISPEFSINFSRARMLAPDGRCKTFDASADGFARGEGCVMVVLKRLTDAQAHGDRILALIRGSAINQDGRSSGLTVPNGPAQQAVIRQALHQSGVDPAQISYIEAHGTGTALGDPIEVGALGAVFGPSHSDTAPLYIGSVKTNIGHLEASAGIAGLLKVVLAMQNETLPPHLHFRDPSPHIAWSEIPIAVTQQARPWPTVSQPQLAGVSSFGFSGTNAHAVLESVPPVRVSKADTDRSHHLLTLSAKDPEALHALAQRYTDHLAQYDGRLNALCRSAYQSRSHFQHRLALVVRSVQEAQCQLAAFGQGQPNVIVGQSHPSRRRKIAFLFTGQGAQYVNMGQQLYEQSPVFRAALERCAAILDGELEVPLLDVLYPDSASDLINQTAYTQPALFAIEYALAQLWNAWGIQPAGVMGHSVGEYVAACVAGVMSLEDALRLIAARGRLMQALPSEGSMAAVLAPVEQVTPWLPSNQQVSIAAINGPRSTVISGQCDAMEAVLKQLDRQGIQAVPLTVSHAFHSAQMDPMLDAFSTIARQITYRAPTLGLISNVSGRTAQTEVTQADYWVRHIRQPVQFAAGIQSLVSQDYDLFIEIGPRPILSGMGRACAPQTTATWLPSLRPQQGESADWQTLLTSLATLYVEGIEIDWAGFDAGPTQPLVSLPTYPFQRQRYWAEVTPTSGTEVYATGSVPEKSHPLLGAQLPLAHVDTLHFARRISPESVPFLQAHRVFQTPVLPAVGYVEMALAAGRAVQPDAIISLDAVTFYQAYVLDAPKTLQLVLHPCATGYRFEVFSTPDAEASWIHHAGGQIIVSPVPVQPSDAADALTALQSQCTESIPVETCYQWLAEQGIDYREPFRALQHIRSGPHQVLGQLRLALALNDTAHDYLAHPVLLDAALQSIAALFIDRPEGTTYLPAGVGHVSLQPHVSLDLMRTDVHLWSHAQIQHEEGRLRANIRLFLPDGRLFLSLSDVRLRPASREQVLPQDDFKDWLYQVDWRPEALPIASSAMLLPPDAIAERLMPVFTDLLGQPEALAYRRLLPYLEGLSLVYTQEAFAVLSQHHDPPRIASQHQRFSQQLLGRLVAAEMWPPSTAHETDYPSPSEQLNNLVAQYPQATAELTLLRRCGENLAAVLQGNLDPLTLLFPEGDLTDLTQLYQSSAGAQVMNRLVQQAVLAALSQLPAGRPVRILEIGAGTGGTTAHLLPVLQGSDIDYVFSDVSPLLIAKARERFGPDYSFVNYAVLDIEASPVEQGFTPHHYDMVIAANVLHATADLRQTLGHVSELLAPGGQLVLLEGTQPLQWLELIFGMTEGWWKFADRNLRPHSPLLSANQWQGLLQESGFTDAVVLKPRPPISLPREQAVLVAQWGATASVTAVTPTTWLLLADRQTAQPGLAVELATALGSHDCVLACMGEPYAQHPDGTFTVDPTRPEDMQRLLADLSSANRMPHYVVHLGCLQNPFPEREHESSASLVHRLSPGCESLLHFAQALLQASQLPTLFVVTQGAVAADTEMACSDPAQAPTWGLGRVIALEHPALQCRRIDLDPQASPAQQITMLTAELTAKTDTPLGTLPDTVAYRQGQRWAARLARAATEPPRLTAPEGPFELGISARGTPDNLQMVACERRPPQANELEIRVQAAGLNFIDVLDALDLLPFERDWFGVECVGEVVAVGEEVDHLNVGDVVMALAPGSFRQYVTVPAGLAAVKPGNLSAMQAATIPVNFLTAYYALHEVAHLAPGERILIHAAAGGTGMAAVRLSLQLGAEVFATASPRKWNALKAMGVQHVMHSRTLDFAQEVMTRTQGQGVDVVLNALSGDFISHSLAVLKPDGRFVEIGKRDVWDADQVAQVNPQVAYHLIDLMTVAQQQSQRLQAILQKLRQGFESGQWQPLPLRVFPITEAVSAFRYMQQARHVGKVVLDFDAGVNSDHIAIRADATYLITGGLGGLGCRIAEWLVQQGARHLVLLSRRALAQAPETIQTHVRHLEHMGAQVMVAQADVTQRDQLTAVLADLEQTSPPLRGVIHAAGVLDDGVIEQTTWSRMAQVLAPKVDGAWHLHQLTQTQPLDFFVLFSSAASLLGAPGQGSHVAANSFLDALAHYRQGRGLPGLSINWGAWSTVGAAAERQMDVQLQSRGIGSIAPQQGLDILARLLNRPLLPQMGVVPIHWPQFLQNGRTDAFLADFIAQEETSVAGAIAPTGWATQLAALPAGQHAASLTHLLQTEVAHVLGLPPSRLPDPQHGFFDMGIDSLMAVELQNRLETQLGVHLPSTELFAYPNIAALTAHLVENVLKGQDVAPEAMAVLPQTSTDVAPASDTPAGIAIIGMAGRFPGADDLDAFWQLLQQGKSGICLLSDDELAAAGVEPTMLAQPGFVPAYASFSDPGGFDAGFFGYTPREATILDPQHRVLLECAWTALEHAGYDSQQYQGRIGVYAGASLNSYLLNLYANPQLHDTIDNVELVISNVMGLMPTRVSYQLDLKGPSYGIQTGCSTSLVAVHTACQDLLKHESDIALAGGVTINTAPPGYLYQEGGIASPDGVCRAFDRHGQGTVFGNGVGLVVLKRLPEALADGDHIYAVIKGSATNNDGADKVSLIAPSVAGQTGVIETALHHAGVEPATISYIEAHGTGTALGDPIEVAALNNVFRQYDMTCAIGSVKTNLGHLDAAAGIAGLIKTTLALWHQSLPPSLNFEQPNPNIDFANGPFYVQRERADWPRNGSPRRAGVSSFGMGGTNAHAILEEAPSLERPSSSGRDWQLLVLSAKTPTALEAATTNLRRHLQSHSEHHLADVAYTLQVGRRPMTYRRVCLCRSSAEAVQMLAAEAGCLTQEVATTQPSVVFMFSGDDPHTATGRTLYDSEPHFRRSVDQCTELLKPYPEGSLAARFVYDYALAQLWMSWGVQPTALLAYGVGEYVAACLAGVFSLQEALALVEQHGHLMQCRASVLSEEAAEFEAQIRQMPLKPPQIDCLSRATGTWLSEAEATDPLYWTQREYCPELLRDGIATLLQLPNPCFLNIGVGDTLSARVQQEITANEIETSPIVLPSWPSPGEPRGETEVLLTALARLWLFGVAVKWPDFYRDETRQRVPLPTYPFERQSYWLPLQPAAPIQMPDRKAADMADWFYQPSWKRVALADVRPPDSPCWLILADAHGIGVQLAQRLHQERQRVVLVQVGDTFTMEQDGVYALNPRRREDFQVLAAVLHTSGMMPTHVVHLWSLVDASPSDAGSQDRAGFYSLVYLAQVLSTATSALTISVVTTGVYEVVGTEDIDPLQAMVLGPCKVIPQEYPHVRCRAIDIMSPSQGELGRLVDHLFDELSALEPVVAYRHGRRWVQTFDAIALPKVSPACLRPEGVYLIAGDLVEGLGLVMAQALRHTLQARLVLLGRPGFPAPEEWELWLATHGPQHEISRCIRQLQALGAAGSDFLWFSVGLAHEAQVQDAVTQGMREFGTIHGVIHADTMGDRASYLLDDLTSHQCEEVFHTKVQGLQTLEKAIAAVLPEGDLDFYLLQSSLSSVLGGVGFAAYTAANLYLDALATQRRRVTSTPWISINWDACRLDETPSAGPTLLALALTPEEVWPATERILAQPHLIQVAVSASDLQRRIDQWITHPETLQAPVHPLVTAGESKRDYEAPRNDIERAVARAMQELLGLKRVGIHDNFFDLGGHSLLAIQAVTRLRKEFQVDLPMRDFLFEAPTVAGIAKMISDHQPSMDDQTALASLLDQIEAMTSEEVQDQLQEDPSED